MPNALKKVNGVSKNQKSITQFFKNTTDLVDKAKTESRGQVQSTLTGVTKVTKRKSSCQHNSDTSQVKNGSSNIQNDTFNGALPKKAKKDTFLEFESDFITEEEFQLTQHKENIKSPPRKSTNCEKSRLELINKDRQANNVVANQGRLPLSPVKNTKENKNNDNHVNNDRKEECFVVTDNELKYVKQKTPEKSISNSLRKSSGIRSNPELRNSHPIIKLTSPENVPSTTSIVDSSVNPVDVLDFHDDVFIDEWDAHFEQVQKENLDLSVMQRCEVTSVEHQTNCTKIRLKSSDKEATCLVEGIWRQINLTPRDIVSVIASRCDSESYYSVSNTHGLLVLRPDHLMSTTSVVAGVFCQRKAVLQERFRGIDGGNHAMTVGILIHELVQKALTRRVCDVTELRRMMESIVAASAPMLYEAKITTEEMLQNMIIYIQPLATFVRMYMLDKTGKTEKKQWDVRIDDVLDIEENVCCPELGLKGKIDATLQVTLNNGNGVKSAIVPLELKSGRASGSAEHRGQIILYNMMMSLQRGAHPTDDQQIGALLYLKDKADFREVRCGYPEKRDLIMLRNQLVQYLTTEPESLDPDTITDIEEAPRLLYQRLPSPVHHPSCAKCPYLKLCSLHLWHTRGPSVSESHPLWSLRDAALSHLTSRHLDYFLQQVSLTMMEERAHLVTSPLHTLWNDTVEKRTKRGTCAANLTLKSVRASDNKFIHIFERMHDQDADGNKDAKQARGPQEGEFSIVSIENRCWIAAGVVLANKTQEVQILLERDLSRRLSEGTVYHIDTYESYNTTVQNLSNLGALLEDDDNANRLRSLIIDREEPSKLKKLPRNVAELGKNLLTSLNKQQQRAVLSGVAVTQYCLLEGLPGTGKTQTISMLIQMLVAMKKRVLVTAHTHSAVDTVLSRLPSSIRMMRIGSSSRVSSNLLSVCESSLIKDCDTLKKLEALYSSIEVVGVTCLGAAHAMLSLNNFDICIVDEATQVTQCELLRPLLRVPQFILVGDPEQLPPVVKSKAARRLGLEESLFHRLKDSNATLVLKLQYRMNETLTKFANKVAYNGRLMCANETVQKATVNVNNEVIVKVYGTESPWLVSACSPDLKASAIFIDLGVKKANTNRSCSNAEEACVVLELIAALRRGGVNPTDIGVIAPYRDQVSLVRRAVTSQHHLGPLDVSTVDQFQGKDKSVILYSCTKSEENDDVKEGEVLNDRRRLAVSVTRAKHKLVIIGHARALRKYTSLQRAIEECVKVELPLEERDRLMKKYGDVVF